MEIFNEQKLRAEIAKTWGEHGAHIEVYDMLLKKANVVLPQANVIKSVCDCKPMEYDVDGIRFFKCRICGEPMK